MSESVSASSWQTARLGDVAEIIRGLAFPSTDKSFQEGEGLIACLRTTNVQREVEWSDLWFIPRKHVRNERQVIRTGDILISTANSYELVGKVAQVRNPPVAATLGAFISMIRADAELSPKYIHYQLASSDVQQRIREMASTTTNISNVSTSKLAELDLSIAPRPEQDRIVAEIEKQFTRLDDAVAALKRVQANLNRYRASLLKAACEGRLVPTEAELARKEGRDYEPASELLKRILAERRAKWEADQLQKMIAAGKPPKNEEWKTRYKEPKPPNASMLTELPEGWIWATVEQISTKVVDGVHKKPDYVPSGVPFVTVKNLTAGPGISFDDLHYVTKSDHEEFIKRANPELGDILISKDGTLGVVRAIRTDQVFSIFVSVAMIKPPFRELTDYLEMALCSPQVQIQMVPKGSGLQHIHLEDLREDCIPLPPVGEQHRIVDACSRQISIIDALEEEAQKRSVHAAALRQSILRSAFSGKLVPQNPNDEPASVLLERIRAERAALATNNGNQKATPEAGTANGQRRRRIERLAHRVSGGKGAGK